MWSLALYVDIGLACSSCSGVAVANGEGYGIGTSLVVGHNGILLGAGCWSSALECPVPRSDVASAGIDEVNAFTLLNVDCSIVASGGLLNLKAVDCLILTIVTFIHELELYILAGIAAQVDCELFPTWTIVGIILCPEELVDEQCRRAVDNSIELPGTVY